MSNVKRTKPMRVALNMIVANGPMTAKEMAQRWPSPRTAAEMAYYLLDLNLQGKVQQVNGQGSISQPNVDQKYTLAQ